MIDKSLGLKHAYQPLSQSSWFRSKLLRGIMRDANLKEQPSNVSQHK